jgi:hypothetical protein
METEVNLNPNTPKKKLPLLTAGVSLLAIVLILAVYFWQQTNVNSLAKEKNDLSDRVNMLNSDLAKLKDVEKSNSELNAKIAFLDKALRDATASSRVQIAKLSVVLKSSQKFDSTEPDLGDGIVVELEAKNNSNQILFFSRYAIKLKDGQNRSYTRVVDPYVKGTTPISDQAVQPGETITGSVFFEGSPITAGSYTFYYEDQSFPITLK